METINKDSIYYIFLEILRLHHSRIHTLLDEIGIYPGQPPLLFILNNNDGLSQKEIATKLRVKPSTITVMLRRMEKAELVVRKQDQQDQRVSRVYITEEGKKTCEKAKEAMLVMHKQCFENFTQEETIVLRRLLMQMRDNLAHANDKESI